MDQEQMPNVAESPSIGFESSESATSRLEAGPAAATAGEAADTPKAPARLIEYTRGRQIALPVHTTYALIEQPTFVAVPGAAQYAYGLMTWQDSRLPLLDLNTLLHPDQGAPLTAAPNYALVVAYQREPKSPLEFGAIGLAGLPRTIAIGDEAQCELPGDSRLWPLLTLSCFEHEGRAIPILDTTRIFSNFHGQGQMEQQAQ